MRHKGQDKMRVMRQKEMTRKNKRKEKEKARQEKRRHEMKWGKKRLDDMKRDGKKTGKKRYENTQDIDPTFIKWSSVFWGQNSQHRGLHGHVSVPALTVIKHELFLVNPKALHTLIMTFRTSYKLHWSYLLWFWLQHDVSIVRVFSQCREVEGFPSSAQEVQQVTKTAVLRYN